MTQRQNIEKVFQPVVQATEKSASQITSEIGKANKPINRALDYYHIHSVELKLDQYF